MIKGLFRDGVIPFGITRRPPKACWTSPPVGGLLTSRPVIDFGDRKSDGIKMARLGTTKKPAIVRVQTELRAGEIASTFRKNGWKFILGIEPDKPEDISDLERLLNPPAPIKSEKVRRNDPCPCGSEKKFKKCCGGSGGVQA